VLHVWYTRFVASSTTSIRLRDELKLRLEEAARDSGKGKNWIITHALEVYLGQLEHKDLAREARRQSINARKSSEADSDHWLKHADTRDWR
jgi:predicted DNA-binding protein